MDTTPFQQARQDLDRELQTYTAVYDGLVDRRLTDEVAAVEAQKAALDQTISTETAAFDQYYAVKVDELRTHIISRRTALTEAVDAATSAFRTYRDQLSSETVAALLTKVYSIRVLLDGEDDFLADSTLETMCALHAKVVEFHTLFWQEDEARDLALFANAYRNLMQSEPPSLDEFALLAMAQRLFVGMTQQKVVAKGGAMMQDMAANGYASYTTPPTPAQQALWHLIGESFSATGALNQRFASGQIVEDWSEDALLGHALSLLLNRHLERFPYTPASAAFNHGLMTWRPDVARLDPSLVAVDDYYTADGFATLVGRSAMALFLETSSSGGLVIDTHVSPDELVSSREWYYPHMPRLELDDQYHLVGNGTRDGSRLAYQRAISSFYSITQWTAHLGTCHLHTSDEWNSRFCQHVPADHPLARLVKPLTRGTSEATNLATIVLVNDLPFSIAGTISNLSAPSLRTLAGKHDAEYLLDFAAVSARAPRSTPVLVTLAHWWHAISTLVDDYLALHYQNDADVQADTALMAWLATMPVVGTTPQSLAQANKLLRMMFFTPVVHELFSNEQLAYDTMENKVHFLVHATEADGLPSAPVQGKLVETLMATSGRAPTFLDGVFDGHIAAPREQAVIQHFVDDLLLLAARIADDPVSYTPLLAPALVECSVCW